MSILISAVVLIAALSLLNVVFVLGVVRRLREHTKLLDALYELAGDGGLSVTGGNFPAAGERIGEFTATTVDGVRVSRDSLADDTVVAFVSPDCRSCHDQLPVFLEWAADRDRDRVLAVVDATAAAPDDLVARLRPVAQVIVERTRQPVADAFRVTSVPGFCVVAGGGTVRAVFGQASRLPVGAPA